MMGLSYILVSFVTLFKDITCQAPPMIKKRDVLAAKPFPCASPPLYWLNAVVRSLATPPEAGHVEKNNAMPNRRRDIRSWIETAREKLTTGSLDASDLDRLERIIETGQSSLRQRILYLHTKQPSVDGDVIGMAECEPIVGKMDEIRTREDWPYSTVQEAMADGWQVIQAPMHGAPYDDREFDFVGFEFILQKLEEFEDDRDD
jgi:hypothetical protein